MTISEDEQRAALLAEFSRAQPTNLELLLALGAATEVRPLAVAVPGDDTDATTG